MCQFHLQQCLVQIEDDHQFVFHEQRLVVERSHLLHLKPQKHQLRFTGVVLLRRRRRACRDGVQVDLPFPAAKA
jgi:hypothetical protein